MLLSEAATVPDSDEIGKVFDFVNTFSVAFFLINAYFWSAYSIKFAHMCIVSFFCLCVCVDIFQLCGSYSGKPTHKQVGHRCRLNEPRPPDTERRFNGFKHVCAHSFAFGIVCLCVCGCAGKVETMQSIAQKGTSGFRSAFIFYLMHSKKMLQIAHTFPVCPTT